MSEELTTKGMPSFVTYLTGLSFTYFLVSALSMLVQSTTEGTDLSAALMLNSMVLGVSALVTLPEMWLMKKSMRLKGFFIPLLAEIGKIAAFSVLLTELDSDMFIFFSGGVLGSLVFSKLFRTRIDGFSQTGLSKNALNLLPSVFFILLFTGGSLLSSLGFGATSQVQNPDFFDTSSVDFSIFNVPSWNAAYYLQNLMDQMTAGLQNPNEVMFNVTIVDQDPYESDPYHSPVAYYRTGTSDYYAYDSKAATNGDWEVSDTKSLRVGYHSTYSKPLSTLLGDDYDSTRREKETTDPNSRQETLVTLQIEKDIDLDGTTWQSVIPAIWNGRGVGAYVSNNLVFDEDDDGTTEEYPLTVDGKSCFGEISCIMYENSLDLSTDYKGAQSWELALGGLDSSKDTATLSYYLDYLKPNYFRTAQYSLDRSSYPIAVGNIWNVINSTFTKLPSGNQVPSSANGEYSQWYSPTATYKNGSSLTENILYTWYKQLKDTISPTASVFNIALSLTQNLTASGVTGANEGADFDASQTDDLYFDLYNWANPLSEFDEGADYPNSGQDYVEWFLLRRKGYAMHFATTLALLLRMFGIPTRLVDGYASGDVQESSTKTVVTALYRHAWVEVLVPMRTDLINTNSYEWVAFDPVASALLGESVLGIPDMSSASLLLDPYSYDPSSTDMDHIIKYDAYRVGIDQKNGSDTNEGTIWDFDSQYNKTVDTGVLKYNTLKDEPSSRYGHVKVGVYTAAVNTISGVPTSFYGIANVDVTFQLIQGTRTIGGGDNVTSDPVVWGLNPYNTTSPAQEIQYITVRSNMSYIAETEFIYDAALHGTGNFSIIATFGTTPWSQEGEENHSITVGAVTDSIRGDDGDDYSIVSWIPGQDPVIALNINYSPLSFKFNLNPTECQYDPIANYTTWPASQGGNIPLIRLDKKINLNQDQSITKTDIFLKSSDNSVNKNFQTADRSPSILWSLGIILNIFGLIAIDFLILKRRK